MPNFSFGDLRESEKPQEIGVVGAHIDTWDIGQGAQDDGSGMMGALEAVLLIKARAPLPNHPAAASSL